MIKSINNNEQTSFGITDTGKARFNNEDYYYFNDTIGVYIVADGMGGHNSGEIASEKSVLYLKKVLSEQHIKDNWKNIKSFVAEQIQAAHINIMNIANKYIEHRGMGCTIAVMIKKHDKAHIWHVGDTRVYSIRQQHIIQLGTDHSYVAEMVQKGLITKEEAWDNEFKNKITMALGIPMKIDPEYIYKKVKKNERLLLCSDGLNDMLKDEEIKEITLKHNNAKKITKALLKKALKKGGKDNITIITHINDE